MTLQSQSARDDLAFMRALVEAGGRTQLVGGGFYLFSGLIYGGQCIADWIALVGRLPLSPALWLAINLGPTVLLAVALPWWIWRNRGQPTPGTIGRAIQAAFGSAGITNLVIVTIFGWTSARAQSPMIWQLYPAIVFALQGAVWLSLFMLRRRLWNLVVAAGWFASAIALSSFVGVTAASAGGYALVAGLALLAFMAVPGWVMIRLARRTA
jgi:hypothetical protein